MIKKLLQGAINILTPHKVIVPEVTESKWVHCDGENNYTVLMPRTQEDVQAGEPAMVCCVIKNTKTNECRLIPYLNIPLIFHRTIAVSTVTHKGNEIAYLSYDIPEC